MQDALIVVPLTSSLPSKTGTKFTLPSFKISWLGCWAYAFLNSASNALYGFSNSTIGVLGLLVRYFMKPWTPAGGRLGISMVF